jgi:hypothetical protein
MKHASKTVIILAVVLALLFGLRLFQLGPFGIRAGDDLVLARTTLAGGARLFVVAHRTESIAEPYEVTLYRVEPDDKVFLYWMGYEDSFWWGCSIRSDQDASLLQIRADGSVAAYYKVQDQSLTFPDDRYHYGVQTGRKAESNTVPVVLALAEKL